LLRNGICHYLQKVNLLISRYQVHCKLTIWYLCAYELNYRDVAFDPMLTCMAKSLMKRTQIRQPTVTTPKYVAIHRPIMSFPTDGFADPPLNLVPSRGALDAHHSPPMIGPNMPWGDQAAPSNAYLLKAPCIDPHSAMPLALSKHGKRSTLSVMDHRDVMLLPRDVDWDHMLMMMTLAA
jgi:hypothetical protein